MLAALASIVLIVPAVLGHGQVVRFTANGVTYPVADAYGAANSSSPVRHVDQYGPVPDFTTKDVTCGPGGNVPTSALAPVKAGQTVMFDWGSWSSSHSGPVMTYLASCGSGGCSTFKGDTGNVWVKIDQDGFNPDRKGFPWGENLLHKQPSLYGVTIPTGLKDGEYLLRHEILGLHVASKPLAAQFYPTCVQIKVTSGGSVALPSGIALPGAYDPTDTNGILVELWKYDQNLAYYIPPGGPVVLPGGTGSWGRETFGGTPQQPIGGASSSTVRPTTSAPSTTSSTPRPVTSSTTVRTTSTAAPPASTGTIQKYGQCGGASWTGATGCITGTTCVKMNDYYSQCQ